MTISKTILSYLVFISGWIFALHYALSLIFNFKSHLIIGGLGGLMIITSGTKIIIFLYQGNKDDKPRIIFEK